VWKSSHGKEREAGRRAAGRLQRGGGAGLVGVGRRSGAERGGGRKGKRKRKWRKENEKREKEKEKGEGKKRKRGDVSASSAAIGRAWPTGGRAARDGTAARENYGQRKKERRWKLDVRTAEQNLAGGIK